MLLEALIDVRGTDFILIFNVNVIMSTSTLTTMTQSAKSSGSSTAAASSGTSRSNLSGMEWLGIGIAVGFGVALILMAVVFCVTNRRATTNIISSAVTFIRPKKKKRTGRDPIKSIEQI
ncbi:Fc.00g008810.m01.CDS01 [Cosmosporella sp. VM-42]